MYHKIIIKNLLYFDKYSTFFEFNHVTVKVRWGKFKKIVHVGLLFGTTPIQPDLVIFNLSNLFNQILVFLLFCNNEDTLYPNCKNFNKSLVNIAIFSLLINKRCFYKPNNNNTNIVQNFYIFLTIIFSLSFQVNTLLHIFSGKVYNTFSKKKELY